MFTILAADAASTAVELTGSSKYEYVLQREASGVDAELDAVVIDRDRVYAAGEGGIVLRRTAGTGWVHEPTPTTKRIRALVVATDEVANGAAADAPIFAVGDGGAVVRRSPDGRWTVEATPTQVDLYDIVSDEGHTYIVGDRGTLLERRAGTWRAIPTNTDADLRRFDGQVAIGKGGAIVDCTRWDREQYTLAHMVACVPRPSPTREDLLASTGDGRHSVWHAYGAGGTLMSAAKRAPIDATLGEPLADRPTIRASVENHYSTSVDTLATILVGDAGVMVFVSGPRRVRVELATAPDLFGVASEALDAFAVGARGTIVHLQTRGVQIPTLSFQ
ncbi:MAG TPA: hypothetical protein VFQ65_02100 [Kofleriaceae bacterium]|nr:hypothetical protein [Kofleriaceae bacterium]